MVCPASDREAIVTPSPVICQYQPEPRLSNGGPSSAALSVTTPLALPESALRSPSICVSSRWSICSRTTPATMR